MKLKNIKTGLKISSLCVALFLAACESTQSTNTYSVSANDAFAPINLENSLYYQNLNSLSEPKSLFNAMVLQSRYYIVNQDLNAAKDNLAKLYGMATTELERNQVYIVQGNIDYMEGKYDQAYSTLVKVNTKILPQQNASYYYTVFAKLNEALLSNNSNDLYFNNAFNAYKSLIPLLDLKQAKIVANRALKLISRKSPSKLSIMLSQSNDFMDKGFYQYALLETSSNAKLKNKMLEQFKLDYKDHILVQIMDAEGTIGKDESSHKINRNVIASLQDGDKVAVLTPQTGRFAATIGNALKYGVLAGLQARKAKLEVVFYDTNNSDISAILDILEKDGTKLIIGPILKDKVDELISKKSKIPAIVFNKSNNTYPDNVVYFDLSPEFEGRLMADYLASESIPRATVIMGKTKRQERIYKGFNQSSQRNMLQSTVCPYENAKSLLNDISTCDFLNTDAIYINAHPMDASLIKTKLNMSKPIYVSDIAYPGINNSGLEMTMAGAVIGDMPWLLSDSKLRTDMVSNIPKADIQTHKIFAIAFDSINIAYALESLQEDKSNVTHGLSGDIHLEGNLLYNAPLWVKLGTPRQ